MVLYKEGKRGRGRSEKHTQWKYRVIKHVSLSEIEGKRFDGGKALHCSGWVCFFEIRGVST